MNARRRTQLQPLGADARNTHLGGKRLRVSFDGVQSGAHSSAAHGQRVNPLQGRLLACNTSYEGGWVVAVVTAVGVITTPTNLEALNPVLHLLGERRKLVAQAKRGCVLGSTQAHEYGYTAQVAINTSTWVVHRTPKLNKCGAHHEVRAADFDHVMELRLFRSQRRQQPRHTCTSERTQRSGHHTYHACQPMRMYGCILHARRPACPYR